MCGIVGIYLKTKKFEKNLGKMLSGMLNNMESRGPDSAGFAIYKNSDRKEYKYSLCINNLDFSKFKKNISQKIKNLKDSFNFLFTKALDASEPYISSKGTTLKRTFKLSAANPRRHSNICPTFILEGTPNGFKIISIGVPSGKYGISCLVKIFEIIPLLPCRPAILSPI